MEKKPYHHGNLKKELIENGIALISKDGYKNFSLRKVAQLANVSPTACYNHFQDKDSLLQSMKEYVTTKFTQALQDAIDTSPASSTSTTIKIGKAYVKFFVEHPNYFSYIFDNDDYCITLSEDDFWGDYPPFTIFRDYSIAVMKQCHVPEEHIRDNLVAMWSMVHGLAAMANMKGFHYNGDWEQLTEEILTNNFLIK